MNQRSAHSTSQTPTSLPIRAGDARLRLFFGGSFDPPHIGHTSLPQRVRVELNEPDALLIYVPAARSPHKQEAPTDDDHRMAMLKLSIVSVPNTMIWTEEIDRAANAITEPSYWVDSWLGVISMGLPGKNRFIIGTDQALSMHRWHRYEEFWRDAIVILRDQQSNRDRFINSMHALGVWSAQDLDHWNERTVITPMTDASSTSIRAMLRDPLRRENPIAGLDDRVHHYILQHGLYLPGS